MTDHAAHLVADAAAPHERLTGLARTAGLERATPCADWDLGALLRHLVFFTPMLAAAGERAPVEPPAASEAEVDLDDGWVERLAEDRARLVTAWSAPQAWEGEVTFMSAEPSPAAMIGGMVLVEHLLHGWDLAQTLGEDVRWPDEVEAAALDVLEDIGPMGREMGAFGPQVAVPDDAPVLHRVLGLAGRDPMR